MCTCVETEKEFILCGSCVQKMLSVVGSRKPVDPKFKSFFGLMPRQVKRAHRTPRNVLGGVLWT